jgi:3-deoxy-D-manno-octulosonate 8-phosphate phosphatase (KDO 8-P phosphatase)
MDVSSLDARLERVRLVSLDVDGVMTDGGLYYAEDGGELRRFNVRDGMGIKALMTAGIPVAFVTSSRTRAIGNRAAALGVPHCLLGVEDKLAALERLCETLRVGLNEVAHVADDVNDLPVLKRVGCPVAVADAHPYVLAAAAFVTERAGGDGAVRELAERLLSIRQATAAARGK